MGWVRCVAIAKKTLKSDIEKTLKASYKYKLLSEKDDYLLYVYEGRIPAELDPKNTHTIGIDDRGRIYYVLGNEKLGRVFEAFVEVIVGVAFPYSEKKKITKDPAMKSLYEKLAKQCPEVWDQKDDNLIGMQFTINPETSESKKLISQLKEFADHLENNNIAHIVSFFDDRFGGKSGEFEMNGYDDIGPSVHAMASYDEEVTIIQTTTVVLNDGESLIDGNTINELK